MMIVDAVLFNNYPYALATQYKQVMEIIYINDKAHKIYVEGLLLLAHERYYFPSRSQKS